MWLILINATAIKASFNTAAVVLLSRTEKLLSIFIQILLNFIDIIWILTAQVVGILLPIIGYLLPVFLEELLVIGYYTVSYGLIPLISYVYQLLVTMISPIDFKRWVPWSKDISRGTAASNSYGGDRELLIHSDQLDFGELTRRA